MQEIKGVKCKKCGKLFYPKRSLCSNCKGNEFEDFNLGNECTLLTYTKLYAMPKGVKQIPLVLGIVEFKNGARVLGQIVTEDIEIGMTLRPLWGALRQIRGQKIYGFQFEPILKK
jgi:uncharacterized OB-fold protein